MRLSLNHSLNTDERGVIDTPKSWSKIDVSVIDCWQIFDIDIAAVGRLVTIVENALLEVFLFLYAAEYEETVTVFLLAFRLDPNFQSLARVRSTYFGSFPADSSAAAPSAAGHSARLQGQSFH